MIIINKKARFNYELLDKLEAGVVLTGPEVKSIKLGHVSLSQSYVKLIQNELFLIGANISPYKFADNTEYDPIRTRKLLLSKNELLKLQKKMEGTNLTLVPSAMYTKKNFIKVEVSIARGKKEFEKKEKKKRADLDREQQRTLRNF